MQIWLKSLCDSGGYAGEAEALAVLRAVLNQLRVRLMLKETVDLAAAAADRTGRLL